MIVYEETPLANVRLFDIENSDSGPIAWRDVTEFLSIFHGKAYGRAPACVTTMCESLNADVTMWPTLMSRDRRDVYLDNIRQDFSAAITGDSDYFQSWFLIREFLNSLCPFEVDTATLHGVLKSRSRTVTPESNVRYSTSSTSTGRLTITEGLNFLVLPKEARKCILRHFKESAIYSIDFTALEPRVMLNATSRPSAREDIYEEIMELYDITDRSVAKLATLSTLYGAGAKRLGATLRDRNLANLLLPKVSDYFGTKKLKASLDRHAQAGLVRNAFGRPLREATSNARLRINHYVQSTAAELAILLFRELCEGFSKVRPLLVIHDALIVEVENSDKDDFLEASEKISYDGTWFPTKCEVLNI